MSRGFLANAFLLASAALRDSMRGTGPGSGNSDDQTPLRAELFSVEQMERHGKSLAATHVLSTSRPRTRLLERLDENERVLIETFDMLTAAVRSRLRIAPSGEWLLDNFYLIEEQIRTARQHLPKEYSRGLPHLAQGPSRGLPRVYDIALEAISHGDGRVDSRTLAPLRGGIPVRHAAHARRVVGHPDHVAARADREPAPCQRPDHDGAGSTRAKRSAGRTR